MAHRLTGWLTPGSPAWLTPGGPSTMPSILKAGRRMAGGNPSVRPPGQLLPVLVAMAVIVVGTGRASLPITTVNAGASLCSAPDGRTLTHIGSLSADEKFGPITVRRVEIPLHESFCPGPVDGSGHPIPSARLPHESARGDHQNELVFRDASRADFNTPTAAHPGRAAGVTVCTGAGGTCASLATAHSSMAAPAIAVSGRLLTLTG